jgi:hypothetical protein
LTSVRVPHAAAGWTSARVDAFVPAQLTRLRVLYIKGNPLPPSELERVRAALPAVTLNTDTPNEVYLHL